MAIPKATREAIKAGIMASFANKQDQLRKELEEVGDNLLAQLLAPHADAMAQLPEDFFLSSSCFGARFDTNSGIHGKQELPLSRPHRIPYAWVSHSAAHGAPALNADHPLVERAIALLEQQRAATLARREALRQAERLMEATGTLKALRQAWPEVDALLHEGTGKVGDNLAEAAQALRSTLAGAA